MASRNQKKCFSAAQFAALLSLVVFSDATGLSEAKGAGVGCLPPTPNPCAADGICRPNQESFGYSQTRWRPWPGDPKPEPPTPVEDPATEEEMKLEPFELPTPEEEDIRGPTKTKSFTPPEEDPSEVSPDPFPELDPQGSIPALPRQDDAPPELPRRLRKFVSASQLAHISMAKTFRTTPSDRFGPNALSARQ